MADFCLAPTIADEFLKRLRNGQIDPEKLSDMTSQERRDFFKEFMGEESAKKTNALFESKLLLKNQQQGMINWAKQVAKLKPEVQRDILAKVNRMTEILKPEEMENFLSDLAEQRLGIGVSADEAGKIADLAKVVQEKKTAWNGKKWTSETARMEYGRAKVAFGDYVGELKLNAEKKSLKEYVYNPVEALSKASGMAKSLKATLDNSALLRQGWKTLWTHPGTWAKNASQSFADILHVVKGQDVMREVKADIASRPNAMNGLYKKEKLALGNIEEAFPEGLPEKIPGLGRIFKASETAYNAFLQRQRADIFDKYVQVAKKTGADIEGVGRLVNSLTGRGNLGALEPVANVINNVFFSPRFLKSQIDVLTAHRFDKKMGKFAKKQAAINLLKVVMGTATVLAIAKAIAPKSVDFDSRSSDFGKIRVGDTRFDVAGGMSSLIVLATKLAIGQSKNSDTGVVTDLNSGKFGAPTKLDAVYNFFEGKLSPAGSVAKDLLKGEDFNGDKPTITGELTNLFVPLPITNTIDTYNNPNAAPLVITMIADGLGIGASTYSKKVKNLDMNNPEQQPLVQEFQRLNKLQQMPSIMNVKDPSGRMLELKNQIGDEKYGEAQTFFTDTYTKEALKLLNSANYKNMKADVKKKRFDKVSEIATVQTLKKFGFKPTRKLHVEDTTQN